MLDLRKEDWVEKFQTTIEFQKSFILASGEPSNLLEEPCSSLGRNGPPRLGWKQTTRSLASVRTWWLWSTAAVTGLVSYAPCKRRAQCYSHGHHNPLFPLYRFTSKRKQSLVAPTDLILKADLRKERLVVWTEAPIAVTGTSTSSVIHSKLPSSSSIALVPFGGSPCCVTQTFSPEAFAMTSFSSRGCFTSSHNSTKDYQEVSKWVTWLPHLFLPVPLCESSSTSISCHNWLPTVTGTTPLLTCWSWYKKALISFWMSKYFTS